MKLLILTQKIDCQDDILGFMNGWVAKLAGQFERIIVVALGIGKYSLPGNVKVLSLGKEEGGSRLKYLVRFYKYIWQERKEYDSVFVHMNQEYVLLGGIFWRLSGKKISMWRNHPSGGFGARIAVWLAHIVFCTSQFTFVNRFKKTQIMPVGVDTDFFQPAGNIKEKNSILFFSRISPIKKPDVFIEALSWLKKEGFSFSAKIIGNAPERDKGYLEQIQQSILDKGLSEVVLIEKGVPNIKAPEIFNNFELSVNLTPSGSLDKTIFEAMACGSLALMENKSLVGRIDERLFFDGTPEDLSNKIKMILSLGEQEKKQLILSGREFVVKNHSLGILAEKLKKYLNN